MSNKKHQSEICDLFSDIISKIDELPLQPQNKILLYSRYLLSKISWDLTITDISQTWVCETLDCIATKYFRKWLELPISATLSNVFLPKNKFGLNVILPSTKFVQCQTVSRSALRSSINENIRELWSVTSSNRNIQYDIYTNTKDVLKAFREKNEQRLQNNLISQVTQHRQKLLVNTQFLMVIGSFQTSKKYIQLHCTVYQQFPPYSKKPCQMGTLIICRLLLLLLSGIPPTCNLWM